MTTVEVKNANGEVIARVRQCPIKGCGRMFGPGERIEYNRHMQVHGLYKDTKREMPCPVF